MKVSVCIRIDTHKPFNLKTVYVLEYIHVTT